MLNATILKIFICMVQVFTTSQRVLQTSISLFTKFVFLGSLYCISLSTQNKNLETSGVFFGSRRINLKMYLQARTTREKGEAYSALFWKLKGVTLFVEENAQIKGIYGYISH